MKLLIAGGTGQVGQALIRHYLEAGHEVILLSRRASDASPKGLTVLRWDGETLGAWAESMNGVDVVINLAGRTVNCRYTAENLKQMMDSRVNSTRVIGEAIAAATTPPPLWLQMSTATIYAHRFDAPNDEANGILGGEEPDAPAYWSFSVDIAKAWERTQAEAKTPHTRKVALRTAMVMTPDAEGIFDVLSGITRWGLGGSIGGGEQYVSWIHEFDFIRAIELLISRDEVRGPVNICAPNPLPQKLFMRQLRKAHGVSVGLPATKWMSEIGAWAMRTDTELVLKSRRVVPGRLLEMGMDFAYPEWSSAAKELVERRRAMA